MRDIRNNESQEAYQKMLDIHKISQTSKSIEDGMGSERLEEVRRNFSWDTLVFLPAQLSNLPLLDNDKVSLETIIGRDAKKPLKIKMPIMISGMSFGAVSREVKIALAKASKIIGTSANSGEGGMLDEERKEADRYIIQLASGRFGQTPDRLKLADAIEIKISQSAKPAKGGVLRGAKVTEEIANVRGLKKGEDAVSPSIHPDIKSPEDLRNKVAQLRKLSDGVPIGIKFAGGHVEKDLEIILNAEPDYIVVDGFGGGTGAVPKYIKDHVSIPHPAFLVRAVNFIKRNKPKRKVSIIATGGFRTSADIAKAIALGADAVYLASATLMAIGCEQYRLCDKGTCPTAIATQNPIFREQFSEDERIPKLVNFYNILSREVADYCRIVGKNNVHMLDSNDLLALTLDSAKVSGVNFISL